MNHKFWSVVFALFVVVLAIDFAFSGEDWQKQSAAKKHAALWTAIKEDSAPGSFPSTLGLLEMFVESMDTSFDATGDDFPKQGPFSLFTRKKLIHSVGAIGQIKYTSLGNHAYTGLFKGSNYGYIRMSSAKKDSERIAAGAGIKFLRNGVPSANFMAMYSLQGQDSWNFFKHDLTNHVPTLNPDSAPLQLRLLKKAFDKASNWATMIGISDVAAYGEDGVAVSNPRFPYRLILHPDKVYRNFFPDTKVTEDYTEQLVKTPTGTLYWVYAESKPRAPPVLIGKIDLVSRLVTSKFADESMFFQHKRMEVDFNAHPEWVDGAKSLLAEEEAAENYVHADLPDQ